MSDPALFVSCGCGAKLVVHLAGVVERERAAFTDAHAACRRATSQPAPETPSGDGPVQTVGTIRTAAHTPVALGFTTPATDRRRRQS